MTSADGPNYIIIPTSQLATLSLSLGEAAAPSAKEGAGGYKYWPTKGNFKYASSAFLLLVHRVPSASLSLPVLLGACRLVLCHGPPLLHLTLNQPPSTWHHQRCLLKTLLGLLEMNFE